MKHKLIILLIAFALPTFAIDIATFENIQSGMTEQEVIALLGEPDFLQTSTKDRILTYSIGGDEQSSFCVRLVEGVVVDTNIFTANQTTTADTRAEPQVVQQTTTIEEPQEEPITDLSEPLLIQQEQPQDEIIYKAREFKGEILPYFTKKKVNVPNKKYKKKRYVGGNMILTHKEFVRFVNMYCDEAFETYNTGEELLWCSMLFDWLCLPVGIVLMGVGIHKQNQMIFVYNSSCANKPQ